MSGAEREPIDLIAFFGLSEEEARGLGLEEGGATVRPVVSARADAAATVPPAPVHPPALLDDTGRLAPSLGPDDVEAGAAPAFPPSDGEPALLPERAEDLPWPTEEEMLAAGPLPDPEFDVSMPTGVRDWVRVAVVPLLEDQVVEGTSPARAGSPADEPAPWLGAALAGPPPDEAAWGASFAQESETPPAYAAEEPPFGRGPYGLTDEQLAELGPDILRELDLAMAEQMGTMPLKMIPDDADAAPDDAVPEPPAAAPVPDTALVDAADAIPLEPSPLAAHAPGAVHEESAAEAPPAVEFVPAPGAVAANDEAALPLGGTEPSGGGFIPSEPPSQSFSGLSLQLLSVFMEEAAEMLDGLHSSLEMLEHGPAEDAVTEARRTVHTIKGGARMCGLRALTELAHACEDVIGQPADAQDSLSAPLIAGLFDAEQEMRAALTRPNVGPGSDEHLRTMAQRLREVRAEADREATLAAAPVERAEEAEAAEEAPGLALSAGSGAAQPSGQPAPIRLGARSSLLRRPAITSVSPQGNRLAVDLQKVEGVVAKVTEIVANRAASHGLVETLSGTVGEVMRTVHRLQGIAIALQYQITAHGLDVTTEQDPDGLALETYGPIRQLMLQLQEAVADQQALVQATMDVVTNKRALAATETRLDTDLQGALLSMRLLPLSQLRVRLDQVVRSAAATAKREVRWLMEGQNVALDKHVCDRLFEPLMHLLRNAIDHGIEPPDEREALGKPRIGRIVVHAAVEGNQAAVSVSDDGRGMDPDRIAAVAVDRGVVTADQAALLTPRERIELVFRPGFSTASAVTELSGRGIGMEIVRETCSRMGGSVAIMPRTGGGTTVILRVPLSMSVIHALIVRENGRLLAIPASQVTSVHLVRPGAAGMREPVETIRIGHEEVPLHRLSPGTPPARESEEICVLQVPYRGQRVALAVEEVVSEDDLVVKPLPLLLQGVERLLGAVILPDGVPVPVLNLPPQLDLVAAQGARPTPPSVTRALAQTVLVVDDSLTMRLALIQSLEHVGYRVWSARDGQEALELIRANGLPQLVTLDIEMPRMDGLETLYAIRQLPGGEALPIFMLTSRASQRHQRTAMKMGATRYFTKPYRDSEFIGAVQEAVGKQLIPAGT